MPLDLSEKAFEAQIEHVLRNGHGYQKRDSGDYDRDLCLIPQDVLDFVSATQPAAWNQLRAIYQAEAESRFLSRLAGEIARRGTLDVLRKGLKDGGQRFQLVYFAPATSMNPDYQRLYEGNVFAALRQLRYKPGSGARTGFGALRQWLAHLHGRTQEQLHRADRAGRHAPIPQ